jgi:hypothetical protein
MSDIAWLVERTIDGAVWYYSAYPQDLPPTDWTRDHMQALGFARKMDAERFHAARLDVNGGRIVQHMWCDRPTNDAIPDPHTETLEQFAERIASKVRKQFMDQLDDHLIGAFGQSHMVFGIACAMKSIEVAVASARSLGYPRDPQNG